jgi:exopolyphosphatase/guanosine-5'-triphosphate,3'-diphosphate pyrophosphatase
MKVRPMPETDGAPPRRDDRSQPLRSDGQRAANGAARDPGASGRDALYGALDLGTNNCRLLIAKPARDGFRVVDSFSRIVRLGEGLSRTGRLDDGAMDRAFDALMLCAERVARKGVGSSRLMAVATQACRQAENGPEFIERVRVGTGLKLRIIDPVEEARLAVRGSFVLEGWMSAPVGVVTLAERHPEPAGDLEDWYEAMVVDMGTAIAEAPVNPALRELFVSGRAHMVGTSGAITSLAGIHLGLRRYQRNLVDGLWMTRNDCEAAADTLKRMGADGRAAEPCIGPDRADLVLAGAAIMEAVQRAWPSERVRVADRGLREGLLLQQMREDRKPARRRRRGRS